MFKRAPATTQSSTLFLNVILGLVLPCENYANKVFGECKAGEKCGKENFLIDILDRRNVVDWGVFKLFDGHIQKSNSILVKKGIIERIMTQRDAHVFYLQVFLKKLLQ